MERETENGMAVEEGEMGILVEPARNVGTSAAVVSASTIPVGGAYSQPMPTAARCHVAEGLLRVATTILRYETHRGPQFIDITDDVARTVASTGISNGLVVVYSRHTTAAIKIQEHEPELIKDMERFLGEILPADRDYYHNDFVVRYVNMEEDESPNGHSHCQHLLMSTSESIPLISGNLQVGRWQRVFLVELDRARRREVAVQTIGC